MSSEMLYNEIGLIDDAIIEEANNDNKKTRHLLRHKWFKWSSIAACFTFLVLVGNMVFNIILYSDFNLSKSDAKVRYVDNAPKDKKEYSLVYLTEEQIFNEYGTDIYRGTIEEIDNIKIKFGFRDEYRAIAKIKISTNYKGSHQSGDTISVLLPCAINTNMWVEHTEVVSSMKVGMSGIFILRKYTETSHMEMDGTTVYWKELAEYGLMDGNRWLFLETDSGIIFDKYTYKSISKTSSINEIEEYIKSKIS